MSALPSSQPLRSALAVPHPRVIGRIHTVDKYHQRPTILKGHDERELFVSLTHLYLRLPQKEAYRWHRNLIIGAFPGMSVRFLQNKNAAGTPTERCLAVVFNNGHELHLAAKSAAQRDEILALLSAFLAAPMPSDAHALNDGEHVQERVRLQHVSSEAGVSADVDRVIGLTLHSSPQPTEAGAERSVAGGSRVSCREDSDSYDIVEAPTQNSPARASENTPSSSAQRDPQLGAANPTPLPIQTSISPVSPTSYAHPYAQSASPGAAAQPYTTFQPSSPGQQQQQQQQWHQPGMPLQPLPASATPGPFPSASERPPAPAPASAALNKANDQAWLARKGAERRHELVTKIQSLRVYQRTMSEVRHCMLQVLTRTPPSFGAVITMCQQVDNQLDELTLLQTSELAKMSVTMNTFQSTLECMFADEPSFESRIAWKQLRKHSKELLRIKFDAKLEIEFADKSTEQVGRLFKSIFDFLSTVSPKQFVNDMIVERVRSRDQELALVLELQEFELKLQELQVQKADNLFVSQQLAERKLRSAELTPEDMADKAVLEQLREQVRAIDLQMRATYVQPDPVMLWGITLFPRQKKVIGNDPELQAQRDKVNLIIGDRLAAYFRRHAAEGVWEQEIAELRLRNLDLDNRIKDLELKKNVPEVALGKLRMQMATTEELIAENQKLLGGLPLEVLRGICDACLMLRGQLRHAKHHAIATFSLAYEETRAIADFVHECAETATDESPSALGEGDRRQLRTQLINIQHMKKQLAVLTSSTTSFALNNAVAGLQIDAAAPGKRIRA